jgi:two-component system chemotaxis response regulator CheY
MTYNNLVYSTFCTILLNSFSILQLNYRGAILILHFQNPVNQQTLYYSNSQKMQVLLLEDEPEVGRLLLTCLDKWNMNGHLAQNGEEALAVLKKSPIDLLITDLVLPKMTGNEVVRQLRQPPQYENLPVLMISGRAQKEDIVEAVELGISGFIAKPFKAAELKRKILEAYKTQRQRNNDQQIARVWSGRLDLIEAAGPLVIFGEPVNSAAQLRQPANRPTRSW